MSDTPSMEARSTRNVLISSCPHSKVTIDVAISERMELVLAKLTQCLLWLKACGGCYHSLLTRSVPHPGKMAFWITSWWQVISANLHGFRRDQTQVTQDPGGQKDRGDDQLITQKGFLFFFFFLKEDSPFFKALMVFKFKFKFFLRVGGSCHSSKQSSILFPGKSAFCPDHAGQDQSWEAGASRTFRDLTR